MVRGNTKRLGFTWEIPRMTGVGRVGGGRGRNKDRQDHEDGGNFAAVDGECT